MTYSFYGFTEPENAVFMHPLQPLRGETFEATANNDDGAHIDVSASGFWGDKHQKSIF